MENLDENMPRQHRQRSYLGWTVLIASILLISAVIAVPFQEGCKHHRLSKELSALGCFVEFSHEQRVPDESAASPGGSVLLRQQSTIPVLEALRLSPVLKRIQRVVVRFKSPVQFEATITVLRQVGVIKHLAVNDPGLTADQLQSLLAAVQCETLFVEGAKLPRGSLPFLNQQPLKFLYLGRSQFSNAAISDLPDRLEQVNLTRTRISDEGLPGFVRLTKLKLLILRRTPTTEEGIRQLRQQMPWCKIDWEPL